MLFNVILLTVPFVFLMVSAVLAVKAFEHGKSRKNTVLMQISSFAAVFAICMACPFVASAATGDAAAAASTAADGMAYIGAAISTGLSCIGGGIAVGNAAPAAIGATSEDPKAFGKAIIFVVLGEGIAIYGMLVSILLIFAR
ncbi:MAG: ATP synthase subunit C [Ruminococcus sp.]|nr:ATP synthase subunit C [Ruminococcus sp.]